MIKYLILFLKKYKVSFCNRKTIYYTDLDYVLFNGRYNVDSLEVFLFEISERKTKKILFIISINKNNSTVKINKL